MASEKGRESEGKREKARTAKRLVPKNFIVSRLGSFIDNTQYKITKRSKQALLQWGQIRETKKIDKKKKSKCQNQDEQ